MSAKNRGQKVFVAMSGGVDSSVAVGLLLEAGYDVEGITMFFGEAHAGGDRASGAILSAVESARQAAATFGIPHHVIDATKEIRDFVITDFVGEYLKGRTPNPCVRCNRYLKFGSLLDKVIACGADFLGTGHYARLHYKRWKRYHELRKGRDRERDQSYFLGDVRRETLPRILFPLGDLTKREVRRLAEKYRLKEAQRPESQDICFIPGRGYKQFIRDYLGDQAFRPGPFSNDKGEQIGQHQGIANYTIGQRDKLGLSLGHPVYVYRIDAATNTVYVGRETNLYAHGLLASRFNPLIPRIPRRRIAVNVRIRYNAPEVRGILTFIDDSRVRVDFRHPQKSVTPGQSVMFYRGDVVLGGAVIDRPLLRGEPDSKDFSLV